MKEVRDATLADLERSGLDKDDFSSMGIQLLSADDTLDLTGKTGPAYKIPYFAADGTLSTYYRVRYLSSKSGRFTPHKAIGQRYWQPPNSAPHVYFPPHLDWQQIISNPKFTILITEGEKKAAAAAKLGIACIGLGGVWSFMSTKRQQELLPDLAAIDWKGRTVEVCYDSDVMWKSEVRRAMDQLCMQLSSAGAKMVNLVFLDAEDTEGKTGLDDYLLASGKAKFKALTRNSFKGNEKLHLLNEKIAWIESKHRIYDIAHGTYFQSAAEFHLAFAPLGRILPTAEDAPTVTSYWLEHPHRRTHADLTYLPGAPQVTQDNRLNIYRAPPPPPAKMPAPKTWLKVVEYVFGDDAPWFLQWLAYPVQHPATKLHTAVFVYSGMTGVGKSTVVEVPMPRIYGMDNYHPLTNQQLQSNFNAYVKGKQFIIADEIYLSKRADRSELTSTVKNMITRPLVSANEKYQPEQTLPDFCNYYLSSNHAEALPLEPQDRRIFVRHAPEKKLPPQLRAAMLEEFRYADDQGTAAVQAVHRYLLNLDTRDFDPYGEAPVTAAKRAVINISGDQPQEFARALRKQPDLTMRSSGMSPKLELWRAEDLMLKCESVYPGSTKGLTVNKFARTLKLAGLLPRKVRQSTGSQCFSLYPVLNADTWRNHRPAKEWARHYEQNSRLFTGAQQ